VDRIARVTQEDLCGLKSPMMSDMPKSASNGNHVEKRLTKQIHA